MDAPDAFDTLLSSITSAMQEARERHQAATQKGDLTAMVAEHKRVMSCSAPARSWSGCATHSPPWWARASQTSREVPPTWAARAARGAKMTGEAFRVPILQVLEQAWGRAPAAVVEDSVGELMAVQLNEVDRARVRSGAVRWRVTLRWACHHMKQEGLLADDSPRGIWEISVEGRGYLQRQHGEA